MSSHNDHSSTFEEEERGDNTCLFVTLGGAVLVAVVAVVVIIACCCCNNKSDKDDAVPVLATSSCYAYTTDATRFPVGKEFCKKSDTIAGDLPVETAKTNKCYMPPTAEQKAAHAIPPADVTNECDKKEYCCATVAPPSKETTCQAFTAITENNALCKATALLPKADTIKCWAKKEDAGTDSVCDVDTCCTKPVAPEYLQAPENTFEGSIQRTDVFQALLLKEKNNFAKYLTRLANVPKAKGMDPFEETPTVPIYPEAAFYQSVLSKMDVYKSAKSPAAAFTTMTAQKPSKDMFMKTTLDTMKGNLVIGGAVPTSDFAAFGSATDAAEVKFRSDHLAAVQKKFDELLQKAAALAVSLVDAASKADYAKMTNPSDPTGEGLDSSTARAKVQTALKNWSIPKATVTAAGADKLYPKAYAYHVTDKNDADHFAYQIITQDIKVLGSTVSLDDGLVELFNYHVTIDDAGTSVGNILNRYTSDELKRILQKVGDLAVEVLNDKANGTKPKGYVPIFIQYLRDLKKSEFSEADLWNLEWCMESDTVPTWETYSQLVHDLTSIGLANKFLGTKIDNGQGGAEHTATFYLTTQSATDGQLFAPQKEPHKVQNPLTKSPITKPAYDPAHALRTFDGSAPAAVLFSFELTEKIAKELYELDATAGKMDSIVFQNLAWLNQNYSSQPTIDCGDWCAPSTHTVNRDDGEDQKKTHQVLLGVFEKMKNNPTVPQTLYDDVAKYPTTVLVPGPAGVSDAFQKLQTTATALVAELKKTNPDGTDLADAISKFNDAYTDSALTTAIQEKFGKDLVLKGLKPVP